MSPDRTEQHLRQQERLAVRSSGLLLGSVGVVAVLAWYVVDRVLEPANAQHFLYARLLAATVMLGALAMLRWGHSGQRRPEWLILLLLSSPQVAIGWMVPRTGDAREAYVLGFSLVVYASGLLLPWRPRYTLGVLGVTWLSLAVGTVSMPTGRAAVDLVSTGFYLGTASVLAVLAQLHRNGLAVRERAGRVALLNEQRRTRELLAQLEQLSYQDPLTGLANRRRWDAELDDVCAGTPGDRPVAVLLCDLDHFKAVNDQLGHAAGDAELQRVADTLVRAVRPGDLVARLGGDELAVLLPNTDLEQAAGVARRLRQAIGDLAPRAADGTRLTISVGVAAGAGGGSPAEVLAGADEQLYRAKGTRDAVWADNRCVASGAVSTAPEAVASAQPKAR